MHWDHLVGWAQGVGGRWRNCNFSLFLVFLVVVIFFFALAVTADADLMPGFPSSKPSTVLPWIGILQALFWWRAPPCGSLGISLPRGAFRPGLHFPSLLSQTGLVSPLVICLAFEFSPWIILERPVVSAVLKCVTIKSSYYFSPGMAARYYMLENDEEMVESTSICW